MAKINRYDGNLKAFAADALGSERTIFGDTAQSNTLDGNITSDLFRGWGIVGVNENPTKQDFNGLGFTLGQLLSYLHQAGVAEWNGSQEYFNGSIVNRTGSLYRCLTAVHISSTVPENDPTNWRFLSGGQTITGSTTFTNATNSIFLTGIGLIGLEVGDVIQVTNTADNDNLFTVDVITNANNIIVNQAHAGGTTTKSLRAETSDAVIRLISKWYNAEPGLGQGWVDVTSFRAKNTNYNGPANRSISFFCRILLSSNSAASAKIEESQTSYASTGSVESRQGVSGSIVPPSGAYSATEEVGNFVLEAWSELR